MDKEIIKKLYKYASAAYKKNEVPISAVLVHDNKIISCAHNKKNINNNALFHAEIICLSKACKKLKRWNLSDCILYVTLEPCEMCKLLIQESRINHVYYLQKRGILNNKYSQTKYEQMYDVDGTIFDGLMENFFKKIREKK